MRNFLSIAILMLTFRSGISQLQYHFDHLLPPDEVSTLLAYSLVQDSLGFLWIHYPMGVVRYDGYDYKVYPYDPEDSIKSPGNPNDGKLLLDRNKNVWLTNHQINDPDHRLILSKYERKIDGFLKYFVNLNRGSAYEVCFDKNNTTLWLGTVDGRGVYSFDVGTGKTKVFQNTYPNEIPDFTKGSAWERRNAIFSIIDRDSILLLGTWSGLWEFNKTTKSFARPKCNPADTSILFHYPIVDILERSEDGKYKIWLTHVADDPSIYSMGKKGITVLDKNLTIVHHYTYPEGFIGRKIALNDAFDIGIAIDKDENVWIPTPNNGLLRYNPKDASLNKLQRIPGVPASLRSNSIKSVSVDRDQNVRVTSEQWISQLRQGLDVRHLHVGGIITFATSFQRMGKDYLVLAKTVTGRPGDNEILISEIIPDKLSDVDFQPIKLLPKIDGLINYLWAGKNYLWIGTWDSGVGKLSIDPQSGWLEGPLGIVRHDSANVNTISSNVTSGVWEDLLGNLWVGTYGNGLNKVSTTVPYGNTGSVTRYMHSSDDSTSISNNVIWWDFYNETKNSFWVRTASGIDLFKDDQFVRAFKSEFMMTVNRTTDGLLYVGKYGKKKGVYAVQKSGNHYTQANSPLVSHGWQFIEDGLGRFWIPGEGGSLMCYDNKSRSNTKFSVKDGFVFGGRHWQFLKTSKGIIIFIDDKDQVTLFDPISFNVSHTNVLPVLSQLIINNRPTEVGNAFSSDAPFRIEKDISILDELTLDYRHNNFALKFSAMEMTAPEKNRYRHKLEGFDKDWIETDYGDRTATYTNLDPGNYLFKVRASNHHGVWSSQERTLHIRILPPPWKTWWAYTGYSLIVVILLIGARRMIVQRERLKANLNLAKVEQEKEHFELEKAREVDQLKSRFFANISHEFRTPITLVLGPLKDIQKQISNPEQQNIIGSVIRNGQRLQRLINQLLDLSKVEAGKMKVQTSRLDLVLLLREITSSYESLAKERNIRYFYNPEVYELMVYADEEKIEKIIHNILSNAFKFTNQGGQITLNLKVQEKYVVIAVTDSGIGIPNDQVDKVFDRFYQVDSSQTRGYEGSGLGLALVKDLVELHHGKISVDSKEGKGTTFTVSLPLGKEHLQKDEIVERGGFERTEVLSQDFISTNGVGIEKEVTKEHGTALGLPAVLIVEDNVDMRQYIRKTLSSHYQIIEAENGKAGVSKAEDVMPDLIISDIMMPETDGYKLCSMIKNKELTSHIPVILLTAKADRESKLSGLEIGADDYLAKPFDAEELKLIVRNRIEERRKMREHFSREITLEPKQVAITSLDEKFITKVLDMIERHMDDEEFSIEDFSQEAGYSRVQFYRKIKGLTDQTPSQFVRSIRLKRAAQLLLAKSDNVSQIAYSVGFSSLAYFNKCFKEQFGITPGQFAEESLRSKI